MQPPGPVRLLHRLGRRRAAGRLRHPGPPRRRAGGHHPRRTARSRADGVGRRPRRHRGQPVRVLHPGHRHAAGGTGAGPRWAGRRRPRPAGPPVPLHGLADGGRGRRPCARRRPVGRPARTPRPRRRRRPGRARGRRRPSGSGPAVVLGDAGFADDGCPADALVAVLDGDGGYAVAASLPEARALADKVQGRSTTVPLSHPVAGTRRGSGCSRWRPPGWSRATSSPTPPGARPAASRPPPTATAARSGASCVPPWPRTPAGWPTAGPAGAGAVVPRGRRAARARSGRRWPAGSPPTAPACCRVGVSGGRLDGPVWDGAAGRRGRRRPRPGGGAGRRGGAAASRPNCGPRCGPRRRCWPPPPVSGARHTRARRGRRGGGAVRAAGPSCACAADGSLEVEVAAGAVLDAVVLRSYAIGAAHQALGWVRSEGIAVSADGSVQDLTVRSFGILQARAVPPITVRIRRRPGRGAGQRLRRGVRGGGGGPVAGGRTAARVADGPRRRRSALTGSGPEPARRDA